MVGKSSKSGHRSSKRKNSGDAAPKDDALRTCAVAKTCGGCSRVNESYESQLARKDSFVNDLFNGADFGDFKLEHIIGMDDPYHYRNKVTSPFIPGKRTATGGREILTGMYAAGSHHVVKTDSCLVENEQAQLVIKAVRSIMMRYKMEPYDERKGKGFIRHVVVRCAHESGEVLVTIVTNADEFPSSKAFCRELVKRCPFVTTIVQNVNTRQTNVILGQKEQRLYGPGFIIDTLCGLSFRISSQSFYQVNSTQTAVLYEKAMQLARLDGTQRALDAYCGTGTIGLVASQRGALHVSGVDTVESAIRDARENARHNGIENATFVAGDAGQFMDEAAQAGEQFDVVFMDPPRAGSDERFLEALAALSPKRVVYISCKPTTQVRDLEYLIKRGYSLETVQPVDMFPHTDHVETIAVMSRTGR